MIHTLDTDWALPPLTLNQRGSWPVHDRARRNVRGVAAVWGRSLHLPVQQHVVVHMFWFVKDHRRRDADNLIATLKPFADGLVDAGIVPDDTPNFMTKHMPVIIVRKDVTPGIRFVLETTWRTGNQSRGMKIATKFHLMGKCCAYPVQITEGTDSLDA